LTHCPYFPWLNSVSPPATDSDQKVKMTGETAKVSTAEILKNLSTFVKWGRDEMEIALAR
jgi:hypothetical protein